MSSFAGALGVAPRTSVLETEILLLNYAPFERVWKDFQRPLPLNSTLTTNPPQAGLWVSYIKNKTLTRSCEPLCGEYASYTTYKTSCIQAFSQLISYF